MSGVDAVAVLSAAVGSIVDASTVAVLDSVEPVNDGESAPVTSTMTEVPDATVPSGQVTSFAATVHPNDAGVTVLTLTPAGIGSVSTTPVASDGPAFATAMCQASG